jgi:hypothetical protein
MHLGRDRLGQIPDAATVREDGDVAASARRVDLGAQNVGTRAAGLTLPVVHEIVGALQSHRARR